MVHHCPKIIRTQQQTLLQYQKGQLYFAFVGKLNLSIYYLNSGVFSVVESKQ